MENLDWEAAIVFVILAIVAYILGVYVLNPEKENRHK